MSDPKVSPEDQEKIMQFYDEINPRYQRGIIRRLTLYPPTFLEEVMKALSACEWYDDSFDKYIEREAHYRMVNEAGGRDPNTLNLTSQQYQEKRDATLRAFVMKGIRDMTFDKHGKSTWFGGYYLPSQLVVTSLTDI